MTTSQRSLCSSTWQRLTQLPPKMLLVIPGVQACQECQEGQDVYCERCVQRMFAFPAGPAAPSRDIGVKGHSGQRVVTIKRRQARFSKHWATDAQVYFQTFKNMVRWKVFGCLWNPPWYPPKIAFLKHMLGTRHIAKLDPPTTPPHKVSHWNLCGVQKNILQTKRKAQRLKLLPFPPVFDSAA